MTTILIDRNVMVPMRDAVWLATDIYRLAGASPTPVLVVRTPYNKYDPEGGGDTFDILRAVQAGYTLVARERDFEQQLPAIRPQQQQLPNNNDRRSIASSMTPRISLV